LAADDIGGALKLISTQTASNSSSLSFTSGIDSTYKEYIFKFINMHPVTDSVRFTVNFRDGSSAFDAVKTTTFFRSKHNEAGSATAFNYEAKIQVVLKQSKILCLVIVIQQQPLMV
jgi:hypothetical protein